MAPRKPARTNQRKKYRLSDVRIITSATNFVLEVALINLGRINFLKIAPTTIPEKMNIRDQIHKLATCVIFSYVRFSNAKVIFPYERFSNTNPPASDANDIISSPR